MLKYNLDSINEQQYKVSQDQVEGLYSPEIKQILGILAKYDFEVRIVGGAVRDILLGQPPRDIDLATNALPDQIIFAFIMEGIEVNTGGLIHGTVKAIINDVKYEITSLAYSIRLNDEGKPVIHTSNSWEEDALRRDYTMNSLSMDLSGNIYDFVGGIKDIQDQLIRGNPQLLNKIKQDPVINLRAYKLTAKLSNCKMTQKTADTLKFTNNLLPSLDLDRVGKNMMDIIKSPNAYNTLKLMSKWGVLKSLNLRDDNAKQVIQKYKESSSTEEALALLVKDQSQLPAMLENITK